MADEKGYIISESDTWGEMIIGIDKEKRILFYLKKTNDKDEYHIINLREIQKGRVVILRKSSLEGKPSNDIAEKVGIALSYYDKGKTELFLEFYNSDTGAFTIGPELQLSEKWVKTIKSEMPSSVKKIMCYVE